MSGSNWFTPRTLRCFSRTGACHREVVLRRRPPISAPIQSHLRTDLENRTPDSSPSAPKPTENFGLFLSRRQEAAEHFFVIDRAQQHDCAGLKYTEKL